MVFYDASQVFCFGKGPTAQAGIVIGGEHWLRSMLNTGDNGLCWKAAICSELIALLRRRR